MSDEDSLNEMHVAPQRLMPKSPSLTEHHKILGLHAVHAGNTIATIKAHKVRQDTLEERLEEIEDVRDLVWEVKAELASQREANKQQSEQFNKMLISHGDLIGQLGDKLVTQSAGSELKKTIVQGIVAVAIAAVTAYGGYTVGHRPETPVYQAPTHQQAQEIDNKIKEFDPDNLKRLNR